MINLKNIRAILLGDKDIKELIANGGISLFLQILGIGLSYFFIFLVTENFGAKGYGIFALCFAILNVFALYGKLGIDIALVKYVGEYSQKNAYGIIKDIYLKIIRIIIPVNLLLSVFLYFLAPCFADIVFNKEYLTEYFRLTALGVLPTSIRFINANCLRGLKKIKEYAFIQNVSVYLIAILSLFVFLKLEFSSIVTPVVCLLIGVFVSFLISFILWNKHSNYKGLERINEINYGQIFKVSMPILLSSSILLIMSWADTFMLAAFCSEEEVGVYNVCFKIASASLIVFMALNTISAPKFAAFYGKENLLGLKALYSKTTKLNILFSAPIYLVLFFCNEFILNTFGEEFREGKIALSILLVAQMSKTIFGTSEYVLQMTNQQKSLTLISLVTVLLNIVLNIFLIPLFKIEGAAVASFVCVFMYQLYIYTKVKNLYL